MKKITKITEKDIERVIKDILEGITVESTVSDKDNTSKVTLSKSGIDCSFKKNSKINVEKTPKCSKITVSDKDNKSETVQNKDSISFKISEILDDLEARAVGITSDGFNFFTKNGERYTMDMFTGELIRLDDEEYTITEEDKVAIRNEFLDELINGDATSIFVNTLNEEDAIAKENKCGNNCHCKCNNEKMYDPEINKAKLLSTLGLDEEDNSIKTFKDSIDRTMMTYEELMEEAEKDPNSIVNMKTWFEEEMDRVLDYRLTMENNKKLSDKAVDMLETLLDRIKDIEDEEELNDKSNLLNIYEISEVMENNSLAYSTRGYIELYKDKDGKVTMNISDKNVDISEELFNPNELYLDNTFLMGTEAFNKIYSGNPNGKFIFHLSDIIDEDIAKRFDGSVPRTLSEILTYVFKTSNNNSIMYDEILNNLVLRKA